MTNQDQDHDNRTPDRDMRITIMRRTEGNVAVSRDIWMDHARSGFLGFLVDRGYITEEERSHK